MKVLIIEDEKPAADKLKQLLAKIDVSITVVAVIETVEHSVNWLQSNLLPDLIFMDIQLNDGICFEIFETIKVNTPIIFITAYNKYVMKAFEVNGIHYLLKPVDLSGLTKAVDKYQLLFSTYKRNYSKIQDVQSGFAKDYKHRFLVKVGSHYTSVLASDIECFYTKDNYTFLRTFGGKKYNLSYSLQQLESLVSAEHFFRVNRNYILNINSIGKIFSFSMNQLKIVLKNYTGSEELLVSREKVGGFKKWLDR